MSDSSNEKVIPNNNNEATDSKVNPPTSGEGEVDGNSWIEIALTSIVLLAPLFGFIGFLYLVIYGVEGLSQLGMITLYAAILVPPLTCIAHIVFLMFINRGVEEMRKYIKVLEDKVAVNKTMTRAAMLGVAGIAILTMFGVVKDRK